MSNCDQSTHKWVSIHPDCCTQHSYQGLRSGHQAQCRDKTSTLHPRSPLNCNLCFLTGKIKGIGVRPPCAMCDRQHYFRNMVFHLTNQYCPLYILQHTALRRLWVQSKLPFGEGFIDTHANAMSGGDTCFSIPVQLSKDS